MAVILLAAACGRENAGERANSKSTRMHAEVRLVADAAALVPGRVVTLGVSFTIDPGWHLYYNGQNETGYPIRVDPDFPPGFRAGALQWPAPVRHISPGNILDHVYTDRVTLLFEVQVPGEALPGDRVLLRIHTQWMACREECIPEEGSADLELPVADPRVELPPPDPEALTWIAQARARLPRAREATPRALSTEWDGGTLLIRAPGAVGLAFYPDTASVALVDLLGSGEAEGETLRLSPRPGDRNHSLSGVLAVTEASGSDEVYISVLEPLPEPHKKETDR